MGVSPASLAVRRIRLPEDVQLRESQRKLLPVVAERAPVAGRTEQGGHRGPNSARVDTANCLSNCGGYLGIERRCVSRRFPGWLVWQCLGAAWASVQEDLKQHVLYR